MVKAWSQRVTYVLLTGTILAYFSEWMFWSGRPLEENFLLIALPSCLVYSCLTYFFLVAVTYFRVRTVWALFLAGALYGWLGEGVLVQTMYDLFPLNISWTGLAWHALISVLFGFSYLPRYLGTRKGILACLLFGLGLGLWSTGWWLEPDISIATVGEVSLYNSVFALILLPVYYFWSRFDIATFQPSRWGFVTMMLIAVLYYAFVTVPTQPLALLILPPCLVFVLWFLRLNLQNSIGLIATIAPFSIRQVLPLLLIPLTASSVYALALMLSISLPTLQILFFITLPLGFGMLILSAYRISRMNIAESKAKNEPL